MSAMLVLALSLVTDRVVYIVCSAVSQSVYHSCEPCKMAEPIDMSFGLWAWVESRKHVLDGGMGNFEGNDVRIFPHTREKDRTL